jgi:hypothetical protein
LTKRQSHVLQNRIFESTTLPEGKYAILAAAGPRRYVTYSTSFPYVMTGVFLPYAAYFSRSRKPNTFPDVHFVFSFLLPQGNRLEKKRQPKSFF